MFMCVYGCFGIASPVFARLLFFMSSWSERQILEFHFIAPIANMGSALQQGVISHNRAARLFDPELCMPDIEAVRAQKRSLWQMMLIRTEKFIVPKLQAASLLSCGVLARNPWSMWLTGTACPPPTVSFNESR